MLTCAELEPHGLYSCPRWLDVLDRGGRAAGVLVGTDRCGGPVLGLLPLHRASPTTNRRYALSRMLRGLPDPPQSDWAFAGPMSAYQTEIAVRSDAHEHAATHLLRHAHALVDHRGLLVPYVTDRCAAALDPDLTRYRLLEDFDCWIETPASDLDSWLVTLPSKRSRRIRRDLRCFAAAGLTATIVPLGEHIATFARLVSNSAARHGGSPDAPAMVGHLRAIAAVFDTDAVLYAAHDRTGALVGAALGIFHRGELFMRMSGFDYDAVDGSSAYFVVAYYEPLRQRECHGYDRVHHGTGALSTKHRHGATLYPLWTLVLGVELDPAHVARANRLRTSELAIEGLTVAG